MDLAAIYAKTRKGQREIAGRHYGLSSRQRQLLIIMDGTKTLGDLTRLLNHNALIDDVRVLLLHALIGAVDAAITSAEHSKNVPLPQTRPSPAIDHVAASRGPSGPLMRHHSPGSAGAGANDPHDCLGSLKTFMIDTMMNYVGLLGANLIRRIEQAKDPKELALMCGHWHMALRESKRGRQFADACLQQLKNELARPSRQ